jgi:transcriptional regulator with AAA-type ATPase domain
MPLSPATVFGLASTSTPASSLSGASRTSQRLTELVSVRFVEAHAHAAIVGSIGVGKTFLAQALGATPRAGAATESSRCGQRGQRSQT